MLPLCRSRLLVRIGMIGVAVVLALGLVACGGGGDASEGAGEDADGAPASVSVPDTASVWSVLQTDDRFTTLATALDTAGLDSLLERGRGPYTLFAPTNAAFERLPEGTVDDLLTERQDRLAAILRYHVVEGRVLAGDLSSTDTLTTVGGASLPVSRVDSAVIVGPDVPVLTANVEASNGLIHVIGSVLRPPEDDG